MSLPGHHQGVDGGFELQRAGDAEHGGGGGNKLPFSIISDIACNRLRLT